MVFAQVSGWNDTPFFAPSPRKGGTTFAGKGQGGIVRLEPLVEEIVAAISAIARTRPGRLAAVTLAVPPTMRREPLALAVRAALLAAGSSDVEVAATTAPGALRVVSVEFAR